MNSDILKYIWSKQKNFNKNFIDFDNLSESDRQNLSKDYILHLNDESISFLSEINWKIHHKKDSIKINRRELIFEWIDIFKYWLSIGLIWNITPEEFISYFEEKSDLVEQRYIQEYVNLEDKKVAVVDIDGVLSDYPKTFIKYIDSKEDSDFSSIKITNLDLYKMFEGKISTERLKQIKHEYRTDGSIRLEDSTEDSIEFLNKLKELGYYVVLLTSRPFDKYKNLYVDTIMWLKSKGLNYDCIINDNKKRDKIVDLSKKSLGIEIIVDDDPRIVSGLLGIDGVKKIYMIDKPYNQNFNDSKVERVKNLMDIFEEKI